MTSKRVFFIVVVLMMSTKVLHKYDTLVASEIAHLIKTVVDSESVASRIRPISLTVTSNLCFRSTTNVFVLI